MVPTARVVNAGALAAGPPNKIVFDVPLLRVSCGPAADRVSGSEPPPPAAAHVPSARRKLVVPPPDPGTTPGTVEVKVLAVSEMVPDEVTGELAIVIAPFAEETPTEVTVPAATVAQVPSPRR